MEVKNFLLGEIFGDIIFKAELTEWHYRDRGQDGHDYTSTDKMVAEGDNSVLHLFKHFVEADLSKQQDIIVMKLLTDKNAYLLSKCAGGIVIKKV